MLLVGTPLKVKVIGIAVLALLTFSLLGMTWGVLHQMAQQDVASPSSTQGQKVSQLDNGGDPADDLAASTFKFVCPFH